MDKKILKGFDIPLFINVIFLVLLGFLPSMLQPKVLAKRCPQGLSSSRRLPLY